MSGETDVVDIAAAPGEEFPVLDTGKGLAEFRAGHRRTVFTLNNPNRETAEIADIYPFIDLKRSVKYQLYLYSRSRRGL